MILYMMYDICIHSESLVYSAEDALAETRVQKPKCCINKSERIYNNVYSYINIFFLGGGAQAH